MKRRKRSGLPRRASEVSSTAAGKQLGQKADREPTKWTTAMKPTSSCFGQGKGSEERHRNMTTLAPRPGPESEQAALQLVA